jgi:hypothetical protein
MSILQKYLAQFLTQTQARLAMNGTTRRGARAFAAACVGVAFVWVLVLGVSPQLHQRIHPDANKVEHSCAVTFVTSGSYHHSHVPLTSAPFLAVQFSKIPALTPQWVESAFLSACIFEHAPPARA